MPADELESAEESLAVLQRVLHCMSNDDWNKQTPCREFNVAQLTDHLMNSINVLGGAAGAELPERDRDGSWRARSIARRETRIGRVAQTRPRRDGDGRLERGARQDHGRHPVARIPGPRLGLREGHRGEVTVPDALSDYVLGLAKTIITPEGRSNVGFDDPVDVAVDARVLDRLIAYTGRRPS